MALHVREGQQVTSDEVLATMDNRVVQAAVQLAHASAERTADLEHAREELELSENLLKRLLRQLFLCLLKKRLNFL